MNFFKNKHIIASMIIAPILAILSWYGVDYFVKEVPHQIENGGHYNLLAKSNCRWQSGMCDLVNNDVEIKLSATQKPNNNLLTLTSSVDFDAIKIAIAESENDKTIPQNMQKQDNGNYQIKFDLIDKNKVLQIVARVDNTIFYAVVPAIFIHKEELIYDKLK